MKNPLTNHQDKISQNPKSLSVKKNKNIVKKQNNQPLIKKKKMNTIIAIKNNNEVKKLNNKGKIKQRISNINFTNMPSFAQINLCQLNEEKQQYLNKEKENSFSLSFLRSFRTLNEEREKRNSSKEKDNDLEILNQKLSTLFDSIHQDDINESPSTYSPKLINMIRTKRKFTRNNN